jgi:hypothetical protein
METKNFVYCILRDEKIVTIYNNINYAMKYLIENNNSIIKPILLNSELNFEPINYNPNSKNFYNSKQFFYIEHSYINIDDLATSNINNKVNIDNQKSDELNLFIPFENIDDDEYYNIEQKKNTELNDIKLNKDLSKTELLEKLRQKISNLKNLKEIEENDLSKIETMMENKKSNFVKNKNKYNKIKKVQNDKKEKIDCLKRKFESDKNTYFKMKDDLENNSLNIVPELFKLKYEILEKMEKNNELNNANSLKIYLQRIPSIQEVYTIEDEQLIGIFGEYYIRESESSDEELNEDSDSESFDFNTDDD